MKRFIRIIVLINLFTIGLLVYVHVAFGGELEEKQAQLSAIEWEFRYCNERMQNLSRQAQDLQKEIQKITASEKNKEKKEKEDLIENER